MVRFILIAMIGVLTPLVIHSPVFADDTIPIVERLGFRTGSRPAMCRPSKHPSVDGTALSSRPHTSCDQSAHAFSLSRFNFSQKREPFNLQTVRDLPSLSNQGGSSLYQASNAIPLFDEALTANLQMVYRDPFIETDPMGMQTQRMGAQLVLKGANGGMTYQAEYGYAGQETGPFATPNDQIGGKFVWKWAFPLVTPQVEISRFTSNADGDVSRSQTVANQQKFSLQWTVPHWPTLALSYSRKQTDVFSRPEGPLADAVNTESVRAKMSYEHERGNGSWTSHYRTSTSDYWEDGSQEEVGTTLNNTVHLFEPVDLTHTWGFTRQTNSMKTLYHDRFFANLGTTYRLTPTFTLNPAFEFTRNINRFDALHTDRLAAKLGYSYLALDESLRVSVAGQYVLSQTSNTQATPQTYDVSLLVKKDIHELLHLAHSHQTLSLKIAHNHQINAYSSSIPSAQTSALVLVSITP